MDNGKLERMATITTGINSFGISAVIRFVQDIRDHKLCAEVIQCSLMLDHAMWVRSMPRCTRIEEKEIPPAYQIPDVSPSTHMVIELEKDLAFTIPLLTMEDLNNTRKSKMDRVVSSHTEHPVDDADLGEGLDQLLEGLRRLSDKIPPPSGESPSNGEHTASSSDHWYDPIASGQNIGQPHVAPIGWHRCDASHGSGGLLSRLFSWLKRKLLRGSGRV